MNKELIQSQIKQLLTENDLHVSGYCSAAPFLGLEEQYRHRVNNKEACELEVRFPIEGLSIPQRQLPNAQSFLVVLEPHSPYEYENEPLTGRMASGSASEDYHHILFRKLEKVKLFLKETHDINSKIIVDTSPLSDRAIAIRAGLGIIRRNNMFYHKSYGSYTHIGSLLMDVDLHDEDHQLVTDQCGQCKRCVAHCPGDAINGDGTINSNRCVSYLTQKKSLSTEETLTIGKMIYGCDVCQSVCPANRGVKNVKPELLVPSTVDCETLLTMSKNTFADTYRKTSAGWRGKRTLQRNAIAVLSNSGSQEGIELIKAFRTESTLLKEAVESALQNK